MPPERRLRFWQIVTVTLMVIGYSGYYLCRSNYSVSLPLIIEWLGKQGISPSDAKIRLGGVASLGTLAYAIGKFISGGLADYLGGRRNFLIGMGGAILFTILFGLGGGIPFFTLAWIGNRAIQSMGWVGMVKITSRWFRYTVYGSVMGVISLSYLFGDALSRMFLGKLIEHHFGWQQIFFVSAGTLSLLLVANFLFLRESPKAWGLPEPEEAKDTLFEDSQEDAPAPSLSQLLSPMLRSPLFWTVCLLSLGMTLIRETFNTWTPTYFQQVLHMSKAAAAAQSAYFPLWGGIAVLLAGFLGDKLGKKGRALIIAGGMVLMGISLFGLAQMSTVETAGIAVTLVSWIGFVLLGPYSFLAGAISLDFGGKKASATAAGIIDGVGYLAGVLAGDSVARISEKFGWSGAFSVLGVVALVCGVVAMGSWALQRRPSLPSL